MKYKSIQSYKKLLEQKLNNFVYHWTSIQGALSILDQDILGRTTYDYPEYHPTKSPGPKVIPGWFSTTRSSKYRPGDIGFVLNLEKIKQQYKTRPYADRSVATDRSGDNFVDSYEARWEAEEIIKGPIKNLNHYVDRILIKQNAFDKIRSIIKNQDQIFKKIQLNLELLSKGQFIPNPNSSLYIDDSTPVDMPIKMKERVTKETYEDQIKRHQTIIKEYNTILQHPKLKII